MSCMHLKIQLKKNLLPSSANYRWVEILSICVAIQNVSLVFLHVSQKLYQCGIKASEQGKMYVHFPAVYFQARFFMVKMKVIKMKDPRRTWSHDVEIALCLVNVSLSSVYDWRLRYPSSLFLASRDPMDYIFLSRCICSYKMVREGKWAFLKTSTYCVLFCLFEGWCLTV